MATDPWPLSSTPPTLDIGPEHAIPAAGEDVTANKVYALGANFTNTVAASIDVTVKNGAGKIVNKFTIAGGKELPYEWGFRPITGLHLSASLDGVVMHMWGWGTL